MISKKNNKNLFLGALLLFCSAFVINFFGNLRIFHFGKDGGLFFRVIATCLISSLFFSVLGKKTLKMWLIGLFIGLGSYIITFFIYMGSSMAIKGDNSGWDIPLICDQLITSTIIFIVGVFYWRSPVGDEGVK